MGQWPAIADISNQVNTGKLKAGDLVNKSLKIIKDKDEYKAQLLTYLKLTGKPKGLLINFNVENITASLVSMVTEKFALLPKE